LEPDGPGGKVIQELQKQLELPLLSMNPITEEELLKF
jgi:hypothetical protein